MFKLFVLAALLAMASATGWNSFTTRLGYPYAATGGYATNGWVNNAGWGKNGLVPGLAPVVKTVVAAPVVAAPVVAVGHGGWAGARAWGGYGGVVRTAVVAPAHGVWGGHW